MKCLIIVDAQNDFFTVSEEDYKNGRGGALAVPNSLEIIPVINNLLPNYDLVVFTKDWHPEQMDCFASTHNKEPFTSFINKQGKEDTLWPDHCVQGTFGAEIHNDIDFSKITGDFYIFKKGLNKDTHPYSGFGAEGLTDFLKERNVDEVHICGLALDYCVADTAIDAVKENFKTVIVLDGTRGIADETTWKAFQNFYDYGIQVVETWEFPLYNLLP